MYMNVFVIVCACLFVTRVAAYERQTEWVWGLLTIGISLLYLQWYNSVVGLIFVSFGLPFLVMTLWKMQQHNNR